MFLHTPDASLMRFLQVCSSGPGLPAEPAEPAPPALRASCADTHLLWRSLEAPRVLRTHRNSAGGSSVATLFSQTRGRCRGEDDELQQSLVTWRLCTIKAVR
ncbi:unnamed protein product [Symbiodinium sp. CCMP2456]|nr:unnamed protein product [Symbiodinium sp. CCMP2456]